MKAAFTTSKSLLFSTMYTIYKDFPKINQIMYKSLKSHCPAPNRSTPLPHINPPLKKKKELFISAQH